MNSQPLSSNLQTWYCKGWNLSHLHHPLWQLTMLQYSFTPRSFFFFLSVSHSKFNNYSVLFFCGCIKPPNLKNNAHTFVKQTFSDDFDFSRPRVKEVAQTGFGLSRVRAVLVCCFRCEIWEVCNLQFRCGCMRWQFCKLRCKSGPQVYSYAEFFDS